MPSISEASRADEIEYRLAIENRDKVAFLKIFNKGLFFGRIKETLSPDDIDWVEKTISEDRSPWEASIASLRVNWAY